MPVKYIYGRAYWIERLIEIGRLIEPDKYTESVIQRIEKYWQDKSLVQLHITVIKRRNGKI